MGYSLHLTPLAQCGVCVGKVHRVKGLAKKEEKMKRASSIDHLGLVDTIANVLAPSASHYDK